MMMGADHVTPLSVERMTASVGLGLNSVKKLISVPLGRTTIWLLSVWKLAPGSKIARAGSHVAPPSVVRAKYVGPRLPASLSHTAYTNRASVESAVIVSLSLKASGPSRINVIGSLQEMPPFVERLTRTALTEPGWSSCPMNEIEIWYAVPSGANVTHGSLARS